MSTFKNKTKSELIEIIESLEMQVQEFKSNEDILLGSEEKFTKTFNSSPSPLIISEIETGNIIDVNRAFANMIMYSREELIAKNVLELNLWVNPEDREKYIKKMKDDKRVSNLEIELRTKSGDIRATLISGEILTIKDKPYLLTSGTDITERKKAEEALKESEGKYRRLAENAPEIIYRFRVSPNPGFEFISSAVTEIAGYTPQEYYDDPELGSNVIHPEDRNKLSELYKGIIPKGPHQVRWIRKDGKIIWTEDRAIPIYDDKGEFIAIEGIAREITAQKEAEEALKEQSYRNEQILETTLDGYILADSYGKILDVNPAYCDMIGYSWEELLKMNIRDVEVKTPPAEVDRRIQQMVRMGGDRFETKHKHKDGHILELDTSTSIMYLNEAPLVAAFVRDITESKLAETALKQSEFFLSQAQRIANLGSYEFDILSGYWTSSNELKGIFGIDDNYNMSVEGWANIVHPEENENMISYFTNNVLKEHQNFDKEYRIKRVNDNEERWVHGLGELEFNAEGQPVKMIGTIQDITENKIAEKKIMTSRNQLRSLAERLQMIREEERATIAREIHDDLGQTLTALKMDISWMKKNPGITEEIRASKINTMLGLTDSTIHNVKRIATELRPGILDDLGLVSAIEWQTKEFQNRSGIECDFEIFVDEFIVEDDISIAVFRIFQESLTNIARHSEATKVTVTIKKINNYLELGITDNGVGITEDQINSQKSLGLIGMNERVSVFRGKLNITRAAEGGTKVRVHIPIIKN